MRTLGLCLFLAMASCKEQAGEHGHSNQTTSDTSAAMYTCPMPEDSVFSERPGTCPKCGMQLIKLRKLSEYTCPMHPEVQSGTPGQCPKCGMDMVPMGSKKQIDTLAALVQSTNQYVVSSLEAISPSTDKASKHILVQGFLTYDPNKASSLSARVSGRIEKLFVRSNFQRVTKGEKLMEIYSPELQTAQSEYLYMIQSNDRGDSSAIQGIHARLLYLGMTKGNLSVLERSRKIAPTVPVYATSSGHVHFLNGTVDISSHVFQNTSVSNGMANSPKDGEENQVLREGDYVQKGDLLFAIADQSTIWAVLKVMPSDISSIKKGQDVELTINDMVHQGKVDFIEKSFEDFYTVRVYLPCEDHTEMKIGNLVQGTISVKVNEHGTLWVPSLAIIGLGKSKSAVFIKSELGYQAKEVLVGSTSTQWTEVISGLTKDDQIAPVASYLVDSEAFIETE